MSVDKRIVQMQFNNAQFEAGVAQSMSTLDKLEEKLNFKSSAKGMTNLQTAINDVSFMALSKGIENIEKRFSTMGIVGMTVVQKITNSALSAAKQIEQATIGQITSGGWSRAMNIADAQFRVEGLGYDWGKIYDAANYGVQDTAYGLDAAAKAASQLAASGIDFEHAINGTNLTQMHKTLRAISGLAAMTNSSYEDISNIFVKVAGTNRLYATELNSISFKGINAAATLAKTLGTSEEAVKEMVRKGEIDFATFANAMDEAFGEHAKEANKTLTGSLSNMKAALSRIGALFATPIVEKTNVLYNALTSRINDVKNALSDLKDEDGVVIQTRFATHFAEAWEAAMSASEKLIKAVDLSWFDRLAEKADNTIIKIRDFFQYLNGELEQTAEESTEAVKEIEYSADEIQAAMDIWLKGKYGTGQTRINALTAAGLDAKNVQSYIDKFIVTGKYLQETTEDIEENIGDAAESVSDFGNAAEAVAKSKSLITFKDVLESIKNTGEIIRNVFLKLKGDWEQILDAFTDVFSFSEIAEGTRKFTGKLAKLTAVFVPVEKKATLLKSVFAIIFSVLKVGIKIVASIADAILDLANALFSSKNAAKETSGEVTKSVSVFDHLGNILAKIADGSKNFANSLSEFVSLLKQTSGVQRLAEAFVGLKNAISGSTSGALNSIGSAIADFDDNFSVPTIEDVANAVGWLADKLAIFVEKLPQWGDSVEKFFIKMKNVIGGAFDKLGIDPKVIKDEIVGLFTSDGSMLEKIKSFFASLFNGIITMLDDIDWGKVKDVSVIALTVVNLWRLQTALGSVSKLVISIKKIPDLIAKVMGGINKVLSSITISLKMAAVGYTVGMIGRALLAIAAAIYILASIPESDLNRAYNKIQNMGLLLLLLSATFGTMAKKNSENTNSLVANIAPGWMFDLATVIVSLGVATRLIVSAMESLGEMDAGSIVGTSVVILGILAAILVSVSIIVEMLTLLSKSNDALGTNMSFLSLLGIAAVVITLGITIKMIASAMETIDDVADLGVFWPTIGIMVALFAGMFAIFNAISKLEPGQAWAAAGILAAVGLALTSIMVKMTAIALIGTDKIAVSLFVVMSVLSSIALVIQQFTNVMKSTESPMWIIAAILSLTVLVEGIADAFSKIFKAVESLGSENFTGKLLGGIGAIIGTIIAITTAIAVIGAMLKKNKNLKVNDLMTIGSAFIEIAAAMLLTAASFKLLESSSNIGTTAAIFLTILAVFTTLVAVAAGIESVANKIGKISDSFLKLGASMALVGVSFLAVSGGIAIIAKSLPQLATGLTKLFAVINKNKVLFTVVTVALLAITALVVYAVSKIAPLLTGLFNIFGTIFKAIGKLLTTGASKLSTWFSGLSAQTKTAIFAIIIGLCGALYEASPAVIDTIVNVIIIILDRLADLIDGIAQALLNLIIKLIYALSNAVLSNRHRILAALMSVVTAIVSLLLSAASGVVGWLGDKIEDLFGENWLSDAVQDWALEIEDCADSLEANTYEMQKNADEMDNYTTAAKELTLAANGAKDSTSSLADLLGVAGGAFKQATISAEEYHDALDELGSRHQGMGISSNMEGAYWNELVKAHPELLEELHEIENDIAKSGSSAASLFGNSFTNGMTDSFGGFNFDFDTSAFDLPEGYEFGTDYGNGIVNAYDETTSSGLEKSTQSSINRTIVVFEDNQGRMEEAASDLGGSGVKGSDSRIKDFVTSGQNMANGLANGVKMKTKMLAEVVTELGVSMINAFNATLDEHSPSRVFEQSGIYAVEGVVKGITAKEHEATTAISDVGDAMIVSFGAPLEYLAKMASGEIQYDTSIRPVLDASNIRAGASGINSMFSNQNVALSTVSGKITSDIGQLDSRNMDVVNELRSLRSDMAEMTAAISGMQMVMDTGALVGQISGPINQNLGKRAIYKKRGN